jgi:nucleoside 2-deoxyribosyltransferase
MLIIYLATPYSHSNFQIQQDRFSLACQITAKLINQGHLVFSPIAHGHPISLHGNVATHWEHWKMLDVALLSRCDSLWVAMIQGWESSVGIKAELGIAKKLGKPIFFLCPTTLVVNPYVENCHAL